MEPVTTTIAVISAVSSILKGVNFTKTAHLTFDQAAPQARALRPAFVEAWAAKYGMSGKSINAQAQRVMEFLNARRSEKSWQIMSGTIADDIQNAIYQYSIENPTQLINYVIEVWCLYCLMNYDASRPDDFSFQFVARTKEVFGIDLSQPSAAPGSSNSSSMSTGSAIDTIANGIKTLFGGDTSTGSSQNIAGTGLSQSSLLIGLGLIFVLFMIFKK